MADNSPGYLFKLSLSIVLPVMVVMALLGRGIWAYYPSFWQTLFSYSHYLGLALLVLLPLLGNGIWEYFWWRDATIQLLVPLDQAEGQMRAEIIAKMPDLLPVWDILSEYRSHFQRLLVITTSYQYCLMRTMQLASLGGGLVLAFVVGNGLAHADPIAKVLFFAFSALALYCGTSTRLLKHDQNIAAYLGHYQSYQLLQLNCYQFALTQTQGPPPATGTNSTLTLNDFLRTLLSKMSQLPTTTFGLDASQITSPADLAKSLKPTG